MLKNIFGMTKVSKLMEMEHLTLSDQKISEIATTKHKKWFNKEKQFFIGRMKTDMEFKLSSIKPIWEISPERIGKERRKLIKL